MPASCFEGDACRRVDVGLDATFGGREGGELAGRVPVERTLPGHRPGQIAEHRHTGEPAAQAGQAVRFPAVGIPAVGIPAVGIPVRSGLVAVVALVGSHGWSLRATGGRRVPRPRHVRSPLGSRHRGFVADPPRRPCPRRWPAAPIGVDQRRHPVTGSPPRPVVRGRRLAGVHRSGRCGNRGVGRRGRPGAAGRSAAQRGPRLRRSTRRGSQRPLPGAGLVGHGLRRVGQQPVPLVEDAPLRPAGDFVFARQLGALEQMADDWRVAQPGRRVAVLRPVVTMAADASGRLAVALAAGMGPPARRGRLTGAVRPPRRRRQRRAAGCGPRSRRRVQRGPGRVGRRGAGPRPGRRRAAAEAARAPPVDDRRGALAVHRGPIPPGLSAYTRWPWLVANDRLKAHGWRPTVTNEQAYVEGTEQRWWTMISPKRRQELALGGLGLGLAGTAIAVVTAIRRARRRPAAAG
jgi:hypothetical protein